MKVNKDMESFGDSKKGNQLLMMYGLCYNERNLKM